MKLPQNITKDHLLKAIDKIDKEGIPKGADSRYYDVIYNDKKYPAKLIVSFGNIFANGTEINRNDFHGGKNSECFKLLERYGFIIVEKTIGLFDKIKVWFVAQGSTFNDEQGKKYLWAPKKGKDGMTRFHWENVKLVKKGDIIFNYSNTAIRGISIAASDGYESINPTAESQWSNEGYRVDISLTFLNPEIKLEKLKENKEILFQLLNDRDYIPFDKNGNVNQGYLFRFSKEAGRYLRDIYGALFGDNQIDEFFDNVELPSYKNEGLHNMKTTILPKPFILLAGISGTGKSRFVIEQAKKSCGLTDSSDPDNLKIIPVRPDWHEPSDLLGYVSRIGGDRFVATDLTKFIVDAWREVFSKGGTIDSLTENARPFWLCLDEMNLAPVEQYFADYLSVLETRKWNVDDGIYTCKALIKNHFELVKRALEKKG